MGVKTALKRGVRLLARCVTPLMPPRVGVNRILTYHSVGRRDHPMNVTPPAFAEQMAWLADHCRVIPVEAAARGEQGVAITFDDGYRDNLTHAVPVLLRHAMPATVFVVAGCLGQVLPHDRDPDTSRLLAAGELAELARAGVSVGAHTMTHARLSALKPEAQRVEITESRRVLGDITGRPVVAFAYPYGTVLDYTPATVAMVREAGYMVAVSNRYGWNRAGDNPFALRRITIDSTDTQASFREKVLGKLDALAVQDARAVALARKHLNRVLDG